MRRAAAGLIALLLVSSIALAGNADPLARARSLMSEIVLVQNSHPVAAIAVPDDAGHRALAEQVRAAVADATGAKLPIIDDEKALAGLGERNLVVIGNLMTNRVAERLYHNFYVASDASQPGPGRYEFRTVHDPEALGIGVVFCGGSDIEGLTVSVARLIAHIEPGESLALPHTVEMDVDGLPAPLTDDAVAEKVAEAKPPYGAVEMIIQQGFNYYRSGNADYLKACKAAIPTLLPAVADEDLLEDLYEMGYLGPVWDQIEEAPCFTDSERAEVCGFLLACIERCRRLLTLWAPEEHPVHYAFAEKAGNLACLYMQRYCPGQTAVDEAARRLRHFYMMQSKFWKPYNEANGYQTTYAREIALWCLTNGEFGYFENGSFAKQCEYQMNAIISNYPYNTCFGDSGGVLAGNSPNHLRIGAWYYGDGRYVWFNDFLRWGGLDWNLYHSYSTDVAPVEAADLYGITVTPAEGWCYEVGMDAPGAPPRERAFDKVTFRSRVDRDADYLLMDGLSNFNHGHADANQIICYTNKGMWGLSSGGYMVKELAEHNVTVVFRDGEGGVKHVPTLADLELAADMRDVGAVRSTLHEYNGADWSRNILWRKGKYFLVIDEVRALQPAEFVLQNWWKLFSNPTEREGRTVTSGGDAVKMQINCVDASALADRTSKYNKSQFQQSVTRELQADESVAFMNLLQTTKVATESAYEVRGYGQSAATVRAPDGDVHLLGSRALPGGGDGPIVRAELFSVDADGFNLVEGRSLQCGGLLFASSEPVTVDYDLKRGRATVELAEAAHVWLAAARGPVRVNTRTCDDVEWSGGGLGLRLPAGKHRVRFAAPADELRASVASALQNTWRASSVPPAVAPGLNSDARQMEQVWSYAPEAENASETRLLQQADVDGNGTQELLVGGEDNFLRCLDDAGKVMWEFAAPAPVCSVWVGDLIGDDAAEVVVGTGKFPHGVKEHGIFILDGEGRELRHLESPTSPASANEAWGAKPGAIDVITCVDVDGDGAREIIAGSTNFHLYCLRPDGEQVWEHLNYAHSPNNLQVVDIDGDGDLEIACATNFYETNVCDLSGEMFFRVKGQGPGLAVADVDGDGVTEFVTGSLKGPLALTEYDPELQFTDYLHKLPGIWAPQPQWSFDTGSDIGALRLADLDGDGVTRIIVCSRNSIVYAFNADGTIHWTRGLGDGVRAMEVADLDSDGNVEVLAGNEQGQVFVLSSAGDVVAQGRAPGLVRYMAAQDLDGDGVAEVLAGTDGPTVTAYTYQP